MKYKSLRILSYDHHGEEFRNIYQNRLQGDSTVVCDFMINGNPAFFVMTNEILNQVSKIYRQHTDITLLTWQLPKIAVEQYKRSILVDEIGLTNELENIHSTRHEIEETLGIVERNESRRSDIRFVGMIEKYNTLMSGVAASVTNCHDIRSIYDKLVMDEVVKENKNDAPDGVIFRKGPVYVENAHGERIHEGVMPESEIIRAMDQAISILNREDIDPLVRTSLYHYLFGYIHPFYNGNGRTSRFISSLMLSKEISPIVSIRLSAAIKGAYGEYKSMFKNTNDKRNYGDLTEFVYTFLSFIAAASNDVYEHLSRNYELLKKIEGMISKSGLFENKYTVLWILVQNALFAVTGLGVTELVAISEKGKTTVENELRKYINKYQIVDAYMDGHRKIYRLDINKLMLLTSEK